MSEQPISTQPDNGFMRLLPLTDLSKLRTRRTTPDADHELEESIRSKGILVPVIVRKNPKYPQLYQVIAGRRRVRAAQALGLETIPAMIYERMSDEQADEIELLENLQRADLHPLDESLGYRDLMARRGYTVARLAAAIGRSIAYIYDRIRLLSLTKDAQKLFLEGAFTTGHAILLARLRPDDQKRALNRDHGGMFAHEVSLWDPTGRDRKQTQTMKPCSVRELQAWIDEHVKFDPKWPDTAELFPATFRAVKTATELAEKVIPITWDHYVQPDARDGQHVFGPRSWKRADGLDKTKTCPSSIVGYIVIGPHRGDSFRVCMDRKDCRIHWAEEQRDARARARAAEKGKTGEDRQTLAEKKRLEQEGRDREQREAFTKARPAILEALAAKLKKAPAHANSPLGELLMIRLSQYGERVKILVPSGRTAEDLVRHLGFAVLASRSQEYRAPSEFPGIARAFGVDVRKIIKTALEKPAAQEKK